MKQYTHPAYSFTLIRQKDGSSYSKQWIYNRASLILEGDQKIWDSVQIIKIYKKFFFNADQKKIDFIKDKFKSIKSVYWFENLIYTTNDNICAAIIFYNKSYSHY